MTIGAGIVWTFVLGIAVYATRVKTEAHDEVVGRRLILWGGVVFPVIVLAALLVYGLRLMPVLRQPGEGLRIEVSGEQFWWRVRYVPLSGPAVASANEIRIPVGERVEFALMQPAAARLPYSELAALAEHYARQPAGRPKDAPPPDPALAAAGEKTAREGVRATDTPACQSCHGPSAAARNPAYPSLAGQHASYLATQLRLWEKEHDSRGGGPFREIMRKVTFRMTPEEIEAVAAYYASLPPGK